MAVRSRSLKNGGAHMGQDATLKKNLVPMILKTFQILEGFREWPEGVTYSDLIQRNPGIPRISVYRILSSLEYLGYIRKDDLTNRYELGAKFIELGRITEKRQDIIRFSLPDMEKLRDKYGENVNLIRIDRGEYVTLKTLEGTHPLRVSHLTDRREAVYSSAAGKAFLTLLDEEERQEILSNLTFRKLTPNTLVPKRRFVEELKRVGEVGYAMDDEENLEGVRCVAAAIRGSQGEPLAAMSVSGPASRMTDDLIKNIAEDLMEVTAKISLRFFGFEESHGMRKAPND
jgi:DNA-binding IclR family transcriptional regulator